MYWTQLSLTLSLLIIFLAPALTSIGVNFAFTENLFVRFLLILYVVMNIRLGALPGLLALLAVFSLYIERSHLLLATFPNQKPIFPGPHGGQATTTALPFEEPKGTEATFEPVEEKALSVVEKHGEHTRFEEYEKADIGDSNPRLAEGPQGSDEGTDFFEQHGLA